MATDDHAKLIAARREATIDPSRADEAELELRRIIEDAYRRMEADKEEARAGSDAVVKQRSLDQAARVLGLEVSLEAMLVQRQCTKAIHDLREENRRQVDGLKRTLVDLIGWLQRIDPKGRAKTPPRVVRKVQHGR